jgi:gamma-glutamyltranspeptidase / glutathione hydrolase
VFENVPIKRLTMNFCANSTTTKPALHSRQGVCVAQNSHAARIGADILRQGGTACDAAVAISFALGVLEPWMSGIGGGGGMLFRDVRNDTVHGIDFGLVAPQALDPATYTLEDGYSTDLFPWRNVTQNRNQTGIHSVATPGVVAGMGRLHALGGRIPWADLLAPAIELAQTGVAGDWYSQLYISTNTSRLLQNSAMNATFLPDGLPPAAARLATGQGVWKLTALANTLERLADAGWQDFYRGEIAIELAGEVAQAGGSLGLTDLEGYAADVRTAEQIKYRDAQVHLAPGLSAGKTLARTLALMPDKVSMDWHEHMALALHQSQAERWAQDGDGAAEGKTDCTTHFSVSDGDGNLISVTQTILSAFGSGVMLPQTGIILNNGMMWFDPIAGKPNSIAPGKRCLMNISPCILQQNESYSAIGAAGGRRILSAVAQLVGMMVDHGMTEQEAIHAPRMDCSVSGLVTVDPVLEPLDIDGLTSQTAPALPWPLTYAIPSILTANSDESVGCADPVSPWAGAASPTSVTAEED